MIKIDVTDEMIDKNIIGEKRICCCPVAQAVKAVIKDNLYVSVAPWSILIGVWEMGALTEHHEFKIRDTPISAFINQYDSWTNLKTAPRPSPFSFELNIRKDLLREP